MPKAKSSRLAQVIAYFDAAEIGQAEDILGIVRDRLKARKQAGIATASAKATQTKGKTHHKKPVAVAADKEETMDAEVAALVGQ